ncbi:MAG: hypothetical protein CMN75_08750 [Spirochaeta sp.]|nr:hypothetical protein [Spirochaeta sp.]
MSRLEDPRIIPKGSGAISAGFGFRAWAGLLSTATMSAFELHTRYNMPVRAVLSEKIEPGRVPDGGR